MHGIKNEQINLINKFKNYLKKFDKNYYKPDKNSIFYPATYTECIGFYVLKKYHYKNQSFLKSFKIILADILYSLKYCKIFETKKKKLFYNRLIVTWAFKNNFLRDGSIDDRYFNINSKNIKNTLWFVIYMDKINPSKIDNNIILFNPVSNRINLLNLLLVFKNLKFLFSINYFLSSISSYSYFSKLFLQNISPYININIKTLLIPYEGQPFQNKLIQYIEKNYPNIKTIGYIHSPPLALPSNFIYKNYSPKKIIVNGQDQIRCFSSILGWNKNDIILMPSFRFLQKKRTSEKFIFLPLNIKNINNVIKSLTYLNEKKIINLNSYKVRNHPLSKNIKENIDAEKKINKLIRDNKVNIKKNKCSAYSIFIGTSGSIIEALESGRKVIQIIEEKIFDYYSQKIWKNIKSKRISGNIFIYKLKKKHQLIKFGKKKNNLKNILNLDKL